MIYLYDTWNYNDSLEKMGLTILTGEACAYGQRLLIDMNADGRKLLQSYFGLTEFAAPWNIHVNGTEAVGSIMLPRSALKDIGIFWLMHVHQCWAVCTPRNRNTSVLMGMTKEEYSKSMQDPTFADSMNCFENMHLKYNQPASNGRNIHTLSGRSI